LLDQANVSAALAPGLAQAKEGLAVAGGEQPRVNKIAAAALT
jgi:hypothetical protein